VIQPSTQEIIPKIIGGWPLNVDDNTDSEELNSSSMLMVFMPWRDLRKLKYGQPDFSSASNNFFHTGSREVKFCIKNIEAYHKCVFGESLVKEGWQTLFG
jgi:hypothetical protein